MWCTFSVLRKCTTCPGQIWKSSHSIRYLLCTFKVWSDKPGLELSEATSHPKRLDVVGRFTYPGSCVSNDESIGLKPNTRIGKARMAYANLLHLWRGGDVSLIVNGRVYNANLTSGVLYECGIWPLRLEMYNFKVSGIDCLQHLAKAGWSEWKIK